MVGFLALLGLVFVSPNPILIIILIFSGMELWQRWQARNHPELQDYYRVTRRSGRSSPSSTSASPILLVLGMEATHLPRDVLR